MVFPEGGAITSKLLLVEGNDDSRFFRALSHSVGINDIVVDIYNGKSNLRNDLAERVRNPDFQTVTSLGIVRDADYSSQSAFDSVIGSLRRAGLPVPGEAVTPVERDGLRVSVLIVPPTDDRGELENVCLSSIQGTPDLQCVESYIDCVDLVGPSIASNDLARARLHSYLAIGPAHTSGEGNVARRQPGLRLGEAADAGVWDWTSPAFAQLADFLRGL